MAPTLTPAAAGAAPVAPPRLKTYVASELTPAALAAATARPRVDFGSILETVSRMKHSALWRQG
jgi:hypothetical protein